MARRKNVKRIDPRYFLHETVNRGEELDECGEMDGEAIGISAPGTEVHVDDISQLSPEDAFAAGMAAARDAIDQAMGGADGPPPEGGFAGGGPAAEPAMHETAMHEWTPSPAPAIRLATKEDWAQLPPVERILRRIRQDVMKPGEVGELASRLEKHHEAGGDITKNRHTQPGQRWGDAADGGAGKQVYTV